MKRTLSALVAGSVAAVAAATTMSQPATATTDGGPAAVGLTASGQLVTFRIEMPKKAKVVGAVSGLSDDSRLVGIDYRPANGLLYGVGDQGGVYTIDRSTGAATLASQLTIALDGMSFGVDFNPVSDRLRIVSDTGQDLRHDVNPGGVTAMDLALSTPPTVGTTTGVTAAGYVNNDNDVDTGTLLFDVNMTMDQAAAQAPANNGTLNVTGKLGKDAVGDAGLDVYSETVAGQTVRNSAWGVFQVGLTRKLYSVDLLTGAATFAGRFPVGVNVVDLAIQPAS